MISPQGVCQDYLLATHNVVTSGGLEQPSRLYNPPGSFFPHANPC